MLFRNPRLARFVTAWVMLSVLMVPLRVLAGTAMSHGPSDGGETAAAVTMSGHMHAADAGEEDGACIKHKVTNCCQFSSCDCPFHIVSAAPPEPFRFTAPFGTTISFVSGKQTLPSSVSAIYRPPRG